MEIQIPVADQDTATESQVTDRTDYFCQPTDRTSCPTISDNWSREGQVSTAILTSRSQALSTVSQPALHSMAETDAETGGFICDGDGSVVLSSVEDPQSTVGRDASVVNQEQPRSSGDDGVMEDPHHTDQSEGSAAEEHAGGSDATRGSCAGSDRQEGAGGEDTEIPLDMGQNDTLDMGQNDSLDIGQKGESLDMGQNGDTLYTGQNSNTLDITEESIAEAGLSEFQEACDDDDAEPSAQQSQEQDFADSLVDQNSQASGDYKGKEANLDTPGNKHKADDNDDDVDKKEESSRDLGKPQLEEEGKVFLTENNHPDDGSDISDARAETPDWAEDGEEKDGGSVSDEGQGCPKRDCLSVTSQGRPLTRSSLHEDVAPGLRAVVNTPVSYYTAVELNADTVRNVESRNTSHAGVETAREAAFQRAMTLMSSRCESKQERQGGPLGAGQHYGYTYPQYFYVQQCRPAPMEPLKAWKGYHGNVYFEPIHIWRVGGGQGEKKGDNPPPSAVSRKSSGSRRTTLTARTRSQVMVPAHTTGGSDSAATGDAAQQSPTRSMTRVTLKRDQRSAKSAVSSSSIGVLSQQHGLFLDRQAVTQPHNSAMQEELQVMERQQSTGSLNIQPRTHPPPGHKTPGRDGGNEPGRATSRRSGARSAKFDRICRGSVAHKLRRAKSGGLLGNSLSRETARQRGHQPWERSTASSPQLMVVGDRFAAGSFMSPLLRTQTQFSLSSQRMTVNSPDLYGAFDRLPPLEQVRISLRHMDTHGEEGLGSRVSSPYGAGTGVGVVEELKPLVKYSPDVRAQFSQQVKYH
ncbi:uncharacterized protein LOC143299003 [Babylonia areolata]|uniref:uncharacterized protein LOC143299003 n=1 Tax=Babylonia areolata TaxID=304850 RepID=UPI003FD663A0